MKHITRSNVLRLLILCYCTQASPQAPSLKQTLGPGGGQINAIAVNDTGYIFAGTAGAGVFRSTNNGESWRAVNDGISLPYVNAFAFNALGQVFAATEGDGVFYSDNSGARWVSSSNSRLIYYALAVAPNGYIFGGGPQGIYRSTDNGRSWGFAGLQNSRVFTFFIAANGDLFAGTSNGIFRSVNEGTDWTPMNQGLTSVEVQALILAKDGAMLAGTRNGGIFRSTDKAASWSFAGLPGNTVQGFAMTQQGEIFTGSRSNGVFRSTDHGLNWISVYDGLSNLDVWTLACNAGSEVYTGTGGGGIYRLKSGAHEWAQINNRLANSHVGALLINARQEVFAGLQNNGIHKFLEDGIAWIRIDGGTVSGFVRALITDAHENIFAGTSDGVFRSSDGGHTWSHLAATVRNLGIIYALTHDIQNQLFAGSPWGIYRTQDQGETWEQVYTGGSRVLTSNAPGHIFSAGSGGVIRSVNGGTSWERITGLNGKNITAFAVDSSNHIFAAEALRFFSFIHRSPDGGTTWEMLGQVPSISCLYVDPDDRIYAGTSASKVLYSTDHGDNWEELALEYALPPQSIVAAIAAKNLDLIFAGTMTRGVFWSGPSPTLNVTPATPPSSTIHESPELFVLEQNYPNPFNAGTKIRYQLPGNKTSYPVSVAIYDLHGRLIRQLVNAVQAPGIHSVVWEGTDLNGKQAPSQVYVYSLQIGKWKESRKLLVLK